MSLKCERCGTKFSAANGECIYYQGKMIFACKTCAVKLNDEINCARKVCAALDGKKVQAEKIINDIDAFAKLLKSLDTALGKIPNTGNLHSDIPFLSSLAKDYMERVYTEISYNTIIAVVSALLYVVSQIDMLPDVIPGVGYEDDAMVVAFCIKMFPKEINKYKTWCAEIGNTL